MSKISIVGPNYQIYHSNFQYECIVEESPPELAGVTHSMDYEWVKDGETISGYDQSILVLNDAEAPAAGVYWCKVYFRDENGTLVDQTESNRITLEMGPENRDLYVSVNIPDVVLCTLGCALTIVPEVDTDAEQVSVSWIRDGVTYMTEPEFSVDCMEENMLGEYTASVSATSRGSYNTAFAVSNFVISEETNITCEPIYIHDLRPARDHGFIWVGYWVTDEIKKAVEDGFDWMADPMNERFIYKCQIANLVRGFNEWEDLEIMESRNGYILGRKDLT